MSLVESALIEIAATVLVLTDAAARIVASVTVLTHARAAPEKMLEIVEVEASTVALTLTLEISVEMVGVARGTSNGIPIYSKHNASLRIP